MIPAATNDPSNKNKGMALIVDNESSDRDHLKSLLNEHGYTVIEAQNANDAVQLCTAPPPDILFLDASMSGDKAVHALRQTDELSPPLPVIFLIDDTTDDETLSRCNDVGGNDFLSRPYMRGILQAKLKIAEHLQALQQKNDHLTRQITKDDEMAENVFNAVVMAHNVAADKIRLLRKPAELFSGDIFLSDYGPKQNINILMGDFTGHGLAAGVGVLPTAEVLRAMTHKGFNPTQILAEINKKLHTLLPTSMFLAAQFVSIQYDLNIITVCNCGMPDMLLLDGTTQKIKARIESQCLPLGIEPDIDFHKAIKYIAINPGDRLLMISDGLPEARDIKGEFFGLPRIEAAINTTKESLSPFDHIVSALEQFCTDAPQDDDISLVEIPLVQEIFFDENTQPTGRIQGKETFDDGRVEFSLTLKGRHLREADPVPMIINQLQEIDGLSRHKRHLFTILTELYVNALDHGILKLNSSLKHFPEGFTRYFTEREQRLAQISEGFISIHITSHASQDGGKLHITIKDSGEGFPLEGDGKQPWSDVNAGKFLSGRGIDLVEKLCEKVIFHPPGNTVEAHYHWNS